MSTYSISTLALGDRVESLNHALSAGDTIAAMRNVDATLNELREITVALVEAGVREGLSQAAMSRALGIPPSALRGARREFA